MDHISLQNVNKPIQSQVSVYTDGSLTMTHCGAGYVIYDNNKTIAESSIKLSFNTTVFQAEIIAIREAVKWLNNNRTDEQQYFKIMTDSQAAFLALAAETFTSKLVKNTIDELNELGTKVARVEIAWIKAHVGHQGNKRADQLAREATSKNEIDFFIADSWTTYKSQL